MYIRLLNPDDAEQYRGLRLQALQLHPEAFLSTYEAEKEMPLEVTSRRLEPAEDKFTLGGFTGQGELAGVVTFIRESREKLRHKGSVFAMYVTPSARKQKLGHSLMSELITRAGQMPGLMTVNLTVFSDNQPAKRLYAALGFTCYGTERNAVKLDGRYLDEDLMTLELDSGEQWQEQDRERDRHQKDGPVIN
ncbi:MULTISPECIES: GNAT family protein [unclassified Paenibacillus]|uniref:GNAT family N-acetyltransferase n=1 Tax=unclassified Paenibacillus TaxID=185978 RepID=UPI002404FEA9|nr:MULTISPECIES: GNAT family protein [unclassified Paenibacillus]MDF9842169.1 RimJ/RimL family protein N-acetyltransferase [Paenibacillus sp. PastF-2]MDF9848577.1 RimJ/RimL family protein N-acetyltransferase [Paenibacillus sp. PastM-2]MDF9855147.1 RimJ/RimL family protein N-acetyltransferase [Paenibacillus sp. PastF-1]MDH6480416.1 RimJ/RimL family protein N-acetyltransferase [Paenibacillus sp. PastH-2]MDH6507845.1 RimJ/RimL family protein N-acetyltransferase [Paenibacillus sp. PastM-3]